MLFQQAQISGIHSSANMGKIIEKGKEATLIIILTKNYEGMYIVATIRVHFLDDIWYRE